MHQDHVEQINAWAWAEVTPSDIRWGIPHDDEYPSHDTVHGEPASCSLPSLLAFRNTVM